MKNKTPPLSPHLGIYRPQISSVLSILHRITGVGNFIGLLLILWRIIYLPYLQSDFTESLIWQFFCTKLGQLLLIAWTFSLFYHTCAGIRYLLLDCGIGFNLKIMHRTGWLVVGSSVVLTLAFWLIIFNSKGV